MAKDFVTHRELGEKCDVHKAEVDSKISQQAEFRHELANDVSTRISELEDHIETKNEKMLDKIEKILILVTHNSDVTKHLSKSYDKIGKELKNHMDEEAVFWEKIDNQFKDKLDTGLFWKLSGIAASLICGSMIYLFSQVSGIHDSSIRIETLLMQAEITN